MRNNKMMRTAAGLLVATLLTSSVLFGTFAKYTSKSTGTDTARVARWGFNDTTSIEFDDLFKKSYDQNVTGEADVIAPGTTNSAKFKFDYTGSKNNAEKAPEVAYTFTVDTTGSSCDQTIQNNTSITWKLDNGKWGTWNELIAAIEALDGDKAQYEAGTLPTEFTGTTEHEVAWKWEFDGNDTEDTTMGNAETLANVTLKITVTATQID